MGRRAILAVCAGFVAACSLAVDLNGLATGTVGADAGAGADGGGSPDGSIASTDGSSDGGASDASAGDGGGADALPSGPFCATQSADAAAHFCRDFEDGPLLLGWTDQNAEYGATILEDASVVSPPNAVRFEMDAGAPICSYVALVKDDFTATVSKVHMEMQALLDPDDAGTFDGNLFFVAKSGTATSASCLLYVDPQASKSSIHEQDTLPDGGVIDIEHETLLTMPQHVWFKVTLDADFVAGKVTLTVDGAPFVQASLDPSTVGAGVPDIALGFNCNGGLPYARSALFDNVLFDGN